MYLVWFGGPLTQSPLCWVAGSCVVSRRLLLLPYQISTT